MSGPGFGFRHGPGPGASLQAFKQPDAGIEATSQGFKLQA